MLEISRALTPEIVGQAIEDTRAAAGVSKVAGARLIGVDRNTFTNWKNGKGIAVVRWLAILWRYKPATLYAFLAGVGIRPAEADEPPDEIGGLIQPFREAWKDPAQRDRLRAALELAQGATGIGTNEAASEEGRAPPNRADGSASTLPARSRS